MDRRLEPARSDRVERAKAAIAARLRHVCSHLDDDEFDRLIQRMAEVEVKYSMRAGMREKLPR